MQDAGLFKGSHEDVYSKPLKQSLNETLPALLTEFSGKVENIFIASNKGELEGFNVKIKARACRNAFKVEEEAVEPCTLEQLKSLLSKPIPEGKVNLVYADFNDANEDNLSPKIKELLPRINKPEAASAATASAEQTVTPPENCIFILICNTKSLALEINDRIGSKNNFDTSRIVCNYNAFVIKWLRGATQGKEKNSDPGGVVKKLKFTHEDTQETDSNSKSTTDNKNNTIAEWINNSGSGASASSSATKNTSK